MLPRIHRLKKKKEIERVFKEGEGDREDFLFLKLAKNYLKASRFAFIVGRQVAKKAVQRNKLKRRLREIIKNKLSRIKTGFDGIIVAKKGAEAKNFNELNEAVDKLLKKAKLL